MCGRFGVFSPPERLAEKFGLDQAPEISPRYNIAPGTDILTVRAEGDRPVLCSALVRWGLIPFWAEDMALGAKMINARAETFFRKPAFRKAAQNRRCLIPADGFYEWADRRKDSRKPFFISLKSGEPFGLAGIWEVWHGPDRGAVESAAIITTEANSLMAPIHNRMPVIIPESGYSRWLDPGETDATALDDLLTPFPAETMIASPVGSYVNNPRHEGRECLAPDSAEQLSLWT